MVLQHNLQAVIPFSDPMKVPRKTGPVVAASLGFADDSACHPVKLGCFFFRAVHNIPESHFQFIPISVGLSG